MIPSQFTLTSAINKLDNVAIPYTNSAKYLGMTLDTKLRWKDHGKRKKLELDIKFAKLYWLLGKRSRVSTHNKILIYKQVLMPMWTCSQQIEEDNLRRGNRTYEHRCVIWTVLSIQIKISCIFLNCMSVFWKTFL